MFIGLKIGTTRADMIRAILEGTAFALRHVTDSALDLGCGIKNMRVAGGGAKSDIWLRIKAAILGVPVLIPKGMAGDATFGGALIAGTAAGIFPDIGSAAKSLVQVDQVINYDSGWKKAYDNLYPVFRQMYQHLDRDLKSLEGIISEIES